MPPDRAEVDRWLQKAANDRRSAEGLLALTPPITDTAAFHCQQAAEKLLKAWLLAHEVEFEKMHDLRNLVLLCATSDPAFATLQSAAATLTPFAVRFRYPGPTDPTLEAVRAALDMVHEIERFVRDRLPPPDPIDAVRRPPPRAPSCASTIEQTHTRVRRMRQTPLIEFHRAAGARLVDFAGWEMPLTYTGIIDEHTFTRQHATFFDVSHMGRVEFRGPDAARFMQRLNTRNIVDMVVGQCRYSHMCREDGGILDDVIVSRCETHYLVVCNASNREKLLPWWDQQRPGFDVTIEDKTLDTAMVAIQGPEALETLDRLLPIKVADLKRYHFKVGAFMGQPYYAARSGYTGEDGVEFIVPARLGPMLIGQMVERSAEIGRPIRPAGLGARDTLRLEAGMPLYGHELTEEWDSITAGQGWAVDLTQGFIGQAVLARVQQEGPRRRIVGFEVLSKRIPRQGARISAVGRDAGVVTSGSHCPTFDKALGMGLIEAGSSEVGTELAIDVRGTPVAAKIVPLPFYKRGR